MDKSSLENSQSKDKIELLSAIQEIVLAFTGAFDLDTLLQKILEIFVEFSNADRGSIFMYESSTQRLVMSAMHNYHPELRFNAYYPTDVNTKKGIGLITLAFIDNKKIVINSNDEIKSHISHSGRYVPEENKNHGTDCNALICIPLRLPNQEPFGVLKLENILVDDQPKIFSPQKVQNLELLTNIVSTSIQKLKNQSSVIDNSIHAILSKILDLNSTGNLSEKLQEIVKTFKEFSKNANNVSIWLEEDAKLVCKSAVGYGEKLIEESYFLPQDKKRIQNIKEGKERIDITPWIFISGKSINIRNHKELVNHPQYKGAYDHILYPDKYKKVEELSHSFIGIPLKNGDRTIGIIQADSSNNSDKGKFFTSEDEHFFSYLAIITSIIVERDKEFRLVQRRDTQLISLYILGTECYEMESINNIFWHLLVGLTHGDGISYNRAMLFKIFDKTSNSITLNGYLALGPKSRNEGKKIKEHFDKDNKPFLKDAKIYNLDNHPNPELQAFINERKISIAKECEFYDFISKVIDEKTSYAQLINIGSCSDTLSKLIREDLETYNGYFLAFSIVDSDRNIWIGICDNVYSNLTQHDEFTIKATNIFVKQISLAVSRLSLKKTNKEIEEEAWQEFTKITAHRIGTETSIMSGALSFLKKSLSSYLQGKKHSEKKDLITLENSLNHLKKAVQEYTELTKPPTIDLKPVQLSDILNTVIQDIKPLQEAKNNDNQYYINNSNVKIIDEYPNELPIILGDKEALLYVFKELIDNAITEMSEGGKLGISSSVFPDEYLIIKITDNGTGINPNNFKKIFELGFRDRPGGTGLGLHIVKKYIESHGGEVWVENKKINWSEDNMWGGACFFIKFPIHKAKIERILIVEDTSIHAEHLTRSIEYLNSTIKIDLAENEHQAIELLNQQIQKTKINPYDFIIADINLTEKGGSEYGGINFLEYLKSNNITAKVIIVTAHAGMEITDSLGNKKNVFERAKELGAHVCISRNQQENYLDEINKIITI